MSRQIDVALSVDALGPKLTGIGRYTLELARGLQGLEQVRRFACFRGDQWIDDFEPLLTEGWRQPGGRLRRTLRNVQGRLSARSAIVHGPNYFLPRWAEGGVITVHDLSVLLYPETHPIERVRDFELRFRASLNRAQCVITDSETVRREVISVLGFREEHVFHVPLGVSPPAMNPTIAAGTALPSALNSFGLVPGQYSLCVSTLEPRKRIDRLVAAYGMLPTQVRHRFPLVLAGARGWKCEALDDAIVQAEHEGWLTRLDYVSDVERDALYRGARLFIYPSLYEGFGLPPLEAMAFGVPTIVGDAETLIEVTKGAARVVDVEDVDRFAETIFENLEDEQQRRALSTSGLAVAASYSWTACVASTFSVFQRVAGGLA